MKSSRPATISTTVLVTGGAGFIGSNFARYLLDHHPDYGVIVLDKLTYAGNLDNLKDLQENPRFSFVKGDICDRSLVFEVAGQVDFILNFAAETHVDRSILEPESFIRTDILGTFVLLEAVKELGIKRFVQISTDEVYGSIEEGSFREDHPLQPSSPYSASKAGADLLVLSYWTTFQLPVLITRSSNNYGPYQYPEKFIPLFITNAMEDEVLPLYGDGMNVRDWIYVLDNCEGIDTVLHQGKLGEIYNIGANQEIPNLHIARQIVKLLGKSQELIRLVPDRKGHDRRYSLDIEKLCSLGWEPRTPFVEQGLPATVEWYQKSRWWWKRIKSGEFKEYYRRQYRYLFEQ